MAQLRRHNLLIPLIRAEEVAKAVGDQAITAEELGSALSAYRQRHQLESQQDLEAHLRRLALTPADFQWQLSLPIRIRKHSHEQFAHKAEARFLKRKNELDRVVYSLLRLKDGALARELYLRIAGGEADFSELAARYSEGPEQSTKGVIGPVSLTQSHPALAERLRTMPLGELIEPFQLMDWWLVVRVERFFPASFDAAMAERMEKELFEQGIEEKVQARIHQMTSGNTGTGPG
ncbi:peptidylprolyl isomerase [Synechococcus sp. Cruz-9H2]|uniref:peptidylprolyl isomerase n=1 Tax=unclassified Synechococcus TaxID=2626047 RepID=UPI0020CB70BF|nr:MULTISPECIES: peptidylprolyl isomerase [unclassified Synechococcus]MCP9820914.1 peptidylprolyl isomerase [Synechococcus sp. Cruz-9H2]MCP9845138.1 peptidylprolyl isomerase [Synechococcus sp. Edmonson 11F2]MCP9857308.1 peptidylprolyl isomerase [Synechococcus sp. Cruz-9C9]MCP9864565.1 peptidylprolyl isomerase [Synechococcus sp. Cruz-7E5]MCP9871834.1 peptidylprolyl isomerase [Synechococcus sp. Cruz-7B9]